MRRLPIAIRVLALTTAACLLIPDLGAQRRSSRGSAGGSSGSRVSSGSSGSRSVSRGSSSSRSSSSRSSSSQASSSRSSSSRGSISSSRSSSSQSRGSTIRTTGGSTSSRPSYGSTRSTTSPSPRVVDTGGSSRGSSLGVTRSGGSVRYLPPESRGSSSTPATSSSSGRSTTSAPAAPAVDTAGVYGSRGAQPTNRITGVEARREAAPSSDRDQGARGQIVDLTGVASPPRRSRFPRSLESTLYERRAGARDERRVQALARDREPASPDRLRDVARHYAERIPADRRGFRAGADATRGLTARERSGATRGPSKGAYGRGPLDRLARPASTVERIAATRGSSGRPSSIVDRRASAGGERGAATESLIRQRELRRTDPARARRIGAAGNAIWNAQRTALSAGISSIAGPTAGSLIRDGGRRSRISADPPVGSKIHTAYWNDPGWNDCGSSWSWGFGLGGNGWWLSFGNSPWYCGSWAYGWSWYWSTKYCLWWSWDHCWHPWSYPYSYAYCSPYVNYGWWSPPVYYSTVVYRYLEPEVVTVVDQPVVVDEPVGEAAVIGRAAEVDPGAPESLALNTAAERYLTLGDRAFREGRYNDAVSFYSKAIQFAPDEGVLHLILADALFATGDYRYAASSIRRALELDPRLAESPVDKHAFYADPSEFDRQLAVLERYVLDHVTDDDARLLLATNFLFGNRPAAAVDLLEEPYATNLRAELAGMLVLDAARRLQYGPAAPSAGADATRQE